MTEYSVREVLEVAIELLSQEPTLNNEFGKIELGGLPLDPVEAMMFVVGHLFELIKMHDQFPQYIINQSRVGRKNSTASEDFEDISHNTLSNKMKSLVKMINVPVPKLPTKKVDFITQNSGSHIPKQVPSKGSKPLTTLNLNSNPSPNSSSNSNPGSNASSISSVSSISGATSSNKASINKLAEFFGAESEIEVDTMISHLNQQPETATQGSSTGTTSEATSSNLKTDNIGDGDDDDDDDIFNGDGRPNRTSNTPKRAAKLAKFFGLPTSEHNIEKIRTELRFQSNMNFYRGCMGENVVRIYIGSKQSESYKSLLISNLTSTKECIKILLSKLDIDSEPEHYSIFEVSENKESEKVLGQEEYPLQYMSKWMEKKSFHLRKNDDVEEPEEFEPKGVKKALSKGKLADFFGVGIMELENASLIKALDQLEPSGTFFELTSPDNEKSLEEVGLVHVQVHFANRTQQKVMISPLFTNENTIEKVCQSQSLVPGCHQLFKLEQNEELIPLDGNLVTWDLVKSWGDTGKLFLKKVREEPEVEVPRDDSEDDLSIFSIDGEVVVFLNENSYEAFSIDGETTTKELLEILVTKLEGNLQNFEKYSLQEVQEEGQVRTLPLDECPLVTKLNSLERFRFFLKKDESSSKEETKEVDSRQSLDLLAEPDSKEVVATKRSMKLAGFFGVDQSQTEVDKMHQMLGSDASQKNLSKRKTLLRKAIYHEGWLQVRRDFEEIGKARWQDCWCVYEKGELVISLVHKSRNQSVSSAGPNIKLNIPGAIISHLSGTKKYAFKIVDKKGIVFDFAATSIPEQNEWMNKLKVGARTKAHEKKEPEKKAKSLEDFEFLKVIGRGHFGKVLLCAEKETGKVYAIKVLKKTKFMSQKDVRNVQAERRIMKGLHHPFIVGLHFAFQSEDRLYLVMEYVNGGELFFHLSCEGYFKENRAKFYAAEILLAMNYLHKQGIIYRDLKLENILMDKDGHMKITDFGLCKDELGVGVQTSTLCGTTEYMAPEVLLNLSYGFPVDWWSFGIVLYEMLCGTHPFYSQNRDQMFYNVLHSELRYPNWISDEAVDLVEALLERNPTLRIGSGPQDGAEIMKHPFFKSINFEALEQGRVPVPFKPNLSGEKDISNIDPEFLKENPVLTPIDKSILMDAAQFQDFSMS